MPIFNNLGDTPNSHHATSPELLPCPFCGGDAGNFGTATRAWIECADDNCAVEGPVRNSRAEAIAAWNTRQPQSPSHAGVTNAMLQSFNEFIGLPWLGSVLEPVGVCDYRHELARKWEPLCRAILAMRAADTSDGEVERLRSALQAIVDFKPRDDLAVPSPHTQIAAFAKEAARAALAIRNGQSTSTDLTRAIDAFPKDGIDSDFVELVERLCAEYERISSDGVQPCEVEK